MSILPKYLVSPKYIPEIILNYILNTSSINCLTFKLCIENITCNINIHFYKLSKNLNDDYYIKMTNMAISFIIKLVGYDTSKKKVFNYYIFNTPFKKIIPLDSEFSEININTGFTFYFNKNKDVKDIVIYRKEEWFKVFIHETLHAFDFELPEKSIKISKYKNFDLNESFVETMARYINVCIYTFQNSKNTQEYTRTLDDILFKEMYFGIQQFMKILKYLKIDGQDLINLKYLKNKDVLSYHFFATLSFIDLEFFLTQVYSIYLEPKNTLSIDATFINGYNKYIDLYKDIKKNKSRSNRMSIIDNFNEKIN